MMRSIGHEGHHPWRINGSLRRRNGHASMRSREGGRGVSGGRVTQASDILGKSCWAAAAARLRTYDGRQLTSVRQVCPGRALAFVKHLCRYILSECAIARHDVNGRRRRGSHHTSSRVTLFHAPDNVTVNRTSKSRPLPF